MNIKSLGSLMISMFVFFSLVMASCSSEDKTIVRPTVIPNSGVSSSRAELNKDYIYTDGEYTATGKYGNLPSSITVTVTLIDDVIDDVKVTTHATNPTSLDLQQRFADAIPAVVVGKHIDEVKIGRLAGSSHTPDGFNAAIKNIKEQAIKSGKRETD
ncbi:MAG: hypothetical protein ACE3L7_13760 [Candidatus Pristimantibacillus sp.]